jgi:hypothetical protein
MNVKPPFLNNNKSCNTDILNPINPCETFILIFTRNDIKDRNSDITIYCADDNPV